MTMVGLVGDTTCSNHGRTRLNSSYGSRLLRRPTTPSVSLSTPARNPWHSLSDQQAASLISRLRPLLQCRRSNHAGALCMQAHHTRQAENIRSLAHSPPTHHMRVRLIGMDRCACRYCGTQYGSAQTADSAMSTMRGMGPISSSRPDVNRDGAE
ncbi:hypothetical protein LZ30DRAFT_29834 [Colletotrichum cereale]|nr:hypothetical protein LZ30DRAFT_29834 [Colletotrichum cereale]